MTEPAGLYVHVPFCASKCAYCDFYSRAIPECAADIPRYLAALDLELAGAPPGLAPRTIFLGGGTPTALPHSDLRRLLALLRRRLDLSGVREWACEANPGTLDEPRARLLAEAGVNRLSIGAQTFIPERLRLLGRRHTPDDIPAAFATARAAGIENLSADLMFGLPGQSVADVTADLDQLLRLSPNHISLYALSIEEGTPWAEQKAAGLLPDDPDDDTVADQYEHAVERLTDAGLPPYEISNFARPGFACLHNTGYWDGTPYIGVGPAAHSFFGGVRRSNPPDVNAWFGALQKGDPPHTFEERLGPEAAAREHFILALRTANGVHSESFRVRTGFDPETLCPDAVSRFLEEGYLERTPDGLRLAPQARFISNTVFRELV